MAEVGPTGLPLGTFELKIGRSFAKSRKKPEYHTLRYDFKPKSMTAESETFISVAPNDDVKIVFATEGKDDMTMYKGAKKPIKDGKECLLVFDESTGEMRIEKIGSNINVKQVRKTGDGVDKDLLEQIEKVRGTRPKRSSPKPHPKTPEPPKLSPEPPKICPGPPKLEPEPVKQDKHKKPDHHHHNPSTKPSKTAQKSHKDEKKEEKKASDVAHMSSSSESESSSSDSSESSDDSDAEEEKPKPQTTAQNLRNRLESSNFSSDDEAALEKHLNASVPSSTHTAKSSPAERPKPAAPLSSQLQVDSLFADLDMPNVPGKHPPPTTTSSASPAVAAPASNVPAPTAKLARKLSPHKIEKNQMLLQNDLDLSESSDED